MKILFTGDIQFGRDYWDISKDCPNDILRNVLPYIEKADLIIFNLESVLSHKNTLNKDDRIEGKTYHILSIPSPLQYLRNSTSKPIIVATINNHTFDYGVKGYEDTIAILNNNNFMYTCGYNYLDLKNCVFFDSTTHGSMGINEDKYKNIDKLWKENCWFIDITNSESIQEALIVIKKVRHRHPNKLIIIALHWGKNWVTDMDSEFEKETDLARLMIDVGCDIIFGNGAHHVVETPYTFYKNKLIIYGLGDLAGDFIYKHSFRSDISLSILYDTNNNNIKKINFTKSFNESECGIPIAM